jgi:hypothetical protein
MIASVGVLISAAALAAPAAPTLDPQHLPVLPARGFAVSGAASVAFVDLQGRVLGRVRGFRFAPENTFGAGLPRFTDSRGRFWRLDRASRRLASDSAGQPLHGGATISFVPRTRRWLVHRHGRVLLKSSPRELPFVSERRDVVTAGGRALDLRTGTFLKVPALCAVASGHRPRWILLCGSARSRSKLPQAIVELAGGKVIARAPVKAPAPNIGPVGHWAGFASRPTAGRCSCSGQRSARRRRSSSLVERPGARGVSAELPTSRSRSVGQGTAERSSTFEQESAVAPTTAVRGCMPSTVIAFAFCSRRRDARRLRCGAASSALR